MNTTSPDPHPRAFLTGAFGLVGEWVLRELLGLGFSVTCFERDAAAPRKQEKKLRQELRFETLWGNLTDAASVRAAIAGSRPDVIVHVAAVIPPSTFKDAKLAQDVNVGGTRNLIEAAERQSSVSRFVFVSSYSVHGPANPYKNPPLWDSHTPLNPQDDYGRQKVEAEQLVRASRLSHVIVRLCAVFPVGGYPMTPDLMRFSYTLPQDRRSQAIDVRDAGLAIAKAAVVSEALGRTFVVGGPGAGWQRTAEDFGREMARSSGMPSFPAAAYRQADPDADASWYFENWVDTEESQGVLGYQRYSFAQYNAERVRRLGLMRLILPFIGGSALKSLLKHSPYLGKPRTIDSRPFEQAAKDAVSG